ncbi:methyltransferase [Halopseudomonas pelagia]|uniref:Methyltransferase n=1 Tax=Halopseudomonas pelagia TaxID=553151 RepID=A0AA91U3H8_9GAMM|nr:methyltransferase [Halopseudomonas pelagia]PCD00075.1 SAM-dependent methyltransferase [Halopseudomonas pelagia]QFY58534.1 methyltransferase [Halopseudomonas pelagia]
MDYVERFQQLDAWLVQHQSVWRATPFTQLKLSWEQEWPELAAWLRSRSLSEAEQAHTQLQALDAPDPFRHLCEQAGILSQVPDWSAEPTRSWPELLERHIPGRKWQQITRFAHASQRGWSRPPQHWLDWCAGKGHLGRLLAWQGGEPLTCLEQDAQLNRDGRMLSQTLQVDAAHLDCDVLTPRAWRQLRPEHSLVALHACGQLHMTLLQQAAHAGCAQIALSPCCYNRIDGDSYHPLSTLAQQSRLQLTRHDLSLPLQATYTAGRRARRLRDQSMAWRLAFDLWQREASGRDLYLPTPSRPESALAQGIAAFCADLAAHHGLILPNGFDWAALEARGWQRLAEVRNLELVGGVFRRPLELWLLLDRALFLQEAGYTVNLGLFAPAHLTPRNFLLLGERNTEQAITSL